MYNRVVGDTLLFRKCFSDEEGTAISAGTCSLTVTDFSGSVVYSGLGTYGANGTWKTNQPSVGFSLGPIGELWRIKSDLGTFTYADNNNYRLIATSACKPYVSSTELSKWYENISDYMDGSEDAMIVDAFNEVNAKLESLGQKMPIKPKADGFYDQPLRDLNAYEAILRIVGRRQSGYNRESETPWFMYFRNQAGSIYRDIGNKIYNFDRDYSVSEGGVGIATKVAGTLPGQVETNWRGNVGNGFSDATYERNWVLSITGTGTSGGVNECPYQWSMDGGITFQTGNTSSLEWNHLGSGVYVRFTRGTGTNGTTNIFGTSDQWNWKTFPVNQTVGGKRTARSY